MHLQLVTCAVGAFGHQYSIVEVPCRYAVDGHNGQSAKIAAAGGFFGVKMRHTARFSQHFFRKDPRQLVFADHHLHIHAEIVRRAQNLNHPADRRSRRRRPTCDFNIHHQAFQIVICRCRFRFITQHPVRRGRLYSLSQFLSGGNQNRLRHALIEGHN